MLTTDSLSRTQELELLTDVLGDATRRGIFLHVTEADHPLTAAEVGEAFGIHRTVARGHLERLVESGLLKSDSLRRPEGGRPPKVYSRSSLRLDLSLPARQYEFLSELLLESLDRFGPAAGMVLREVGLEYGRRLAALTREDTPDALLEPLRRAGGGAQVRGSDEEFEVVVGNCLYRELSTRRPELVCTLDRAIIEGLLNSGPHRYRLEEARRRDEQDDTCTLRFVARPAETCADAAPTVRAAVSPVDGTAGASTETTGGNT
ncbi:MAG: helix-turn-helix domain-containing protein [Thermoleophilia bacterium]